ncbi:hypothetical protein CONPUDRAFT_72161 [Coniophora puteana RWD-64-598 SS2]|uniref:Uncharacterized protein n=1 Tax=Coniophora puteana (strain RWD-64-598) TaxID=741705 RepID=A0A5M3MRI5_CONPW|nr:uncharacterized protein CONPUDRAFT_72161 [Coniophora puteana RWD-64-598 SS2]EIW81763.1 hypothetical protein CONPUDRAFT_72161 [Coniophora puteana RWD-64-598 SS2]
MKQVLILHIFLSLQLVSFLRTNPANDGSDVLLSSARSVMDSYKAVVVDDNIVAKHIAAQGAEEHVHGSHWIPGNRGCGSFSSQQERAVRNELAYHPRHLPVLLKGFLRGSLLARDNASALCRIICTRPKGGFCTGVILICNTYTEKRKAPSEVHNEMAESHAMWTSEMVSKKIGRLIGNKSYLSFEGGEHYGPQTLVHVPDGPGGISKAFVSCS